MSITDNYWAFIFASLIGLAIVTAALVLMMKVRGMKKELGDVNKLLEASIRLNSVIHNPDELLSTVMVTAAEVIQAEAASIILKDEATNELYFKVATGEKGNEVKEIRLKMGEGIAGWVAQHGKPLRVDEVTSDTRWSSRVSNQVSFQTRNLICVPIRSKSGVIGVLQAINKKQRDHFSDQDLKLLEAMTLPTGVAIENARLYDSLQKANLTIGH